MKTDSTWIPDFVEIKTTQLSILVSYTETEEI